jgi:molybdopterin converting factor small subunit
MKIFVNLYGGLEKYSKEGKRKNNLIEVSEGALVNDVINILEMPDEEVKIIMVNGIHASLDYELSAGDVVSLFPLLFGG